MEQSVFGDADGGGQLSSSLHGTGAAVQPNVSSQSLVPPNMPTDGLAPPPAGSDPGPVTDPLLGNPLVGSQSLPPP